MSTESEVRNTDGSWFAGVVLWISPDGTKCCIADANGSTRLAHFSGTHPCPKFPPDFEIVASTFVAFRLKVWGDGRPDTIIAVSSVEPNQIDDEDMRDLFTALENYRFEKDTIRKQRRAAARERIGEANWGRKL
jgi:hypothetical protein